MKTKPLHKNKTTKPDHLAQWLGDPRLLEYLGPIPQHRLAVLAAVITGGNISEVARQCGISRQAASLHAIRAREIFGVKVRLTGSQL
jgi:hypothetical protein